MYRRVRFSWSTLWRTGILLFLFAAILLPYQHVSAAPLRAESDDFVITVKTDNPGTSSSTQFTIPTSGIGYNYNVDCDNDGFDDTIGETGNFTCDYPSPGTYTVRIKDNAGDGTGFHRIAFANSGDRLKILTVEQWGTAKWTSMVDAFSGCSNLTIPATDAPDLSAVTDMAVMFSYATKVNPPYIGSWDVSNVIYMGSMFNGASAFNQDIGGWDVSNVANMGSMFEDASAFNQDIGGWDVSSVSNMRNMFFSASAFDQDLNGWDVSNVTNMRGMFFGATAFNGDVSGWNVSNVVDMNDLFHNAPAFNQNIGGWNVANVTKMDHMFQGAATFNQDISTWNTAKVTTMVDMFYGAAAFNQDLGGWDVSNVTTMERMFYGVAAFDQNLGSWNVSNVAAMNNMFYGVTLSVANYDGLLNGWNALTLQNGVTFSGGDSKYCLGETARQNMITSDGWTITDGGKDCSAFSTDHFVITVKTDNAGTSTDTQFTIPTGGSGLNYNVDCDNDGTNEATGQTGSYTCNYASAGTYTVRIKDNVGDGTGFPRIIFGNGGDKLKLLTIEQWGTGKWASMTYAFQGCANLTVPATDTPDLSLVSTLEFTFDGAKALTAPAIGSWDVSTITSTMFLFENASAFNEDLSSWDVSNVTNFRGTFTGATVFNQDISGWDTSKATNLSSMFTNAKAFNQDISGWNTSSATNMAGMFWGASAFNQDIGGWDTSFVTTLNGTFYGATVFNQDISSWDVSQVTNFLYLFTDATAFNQDISGWDTSSATDMRLMFMGATSFDQDLSTWDVSHVTHMLDMFHGVTLSTANYDALLNGWNAQTLQNGVIFSGGNSKYCLGETARQNMIDTDGWTITDGGKDCSMYDDFVITVKTDNSGVSSSSQFTIPVDVAYIYNYNVDCDNDGTNDATAQTGSYTCNYASAGTYTVRIKDNAGDGTGFPAVHFGGTTDKLKLLSVDQWGTGTWQTMNGAFAGCGNADIDATDDPDLSAVTDMQYMFFSAGSITQDVSGWDVSNVTNLAGMFGYADAFNQDLSGWDVSSVTRMDYLFYGATIFNQDISGWNVSSVTNMDSMFTGAYAFNQDLSGWDVSKVTNMNQMFASAETFNQDLNDWDVSNVTNMYGMFNGAYDFNGDISGWNVSKVTNMYGMFYNALAFDQDISGWDVSGIADMRNFFYNAISFDQDLGAWDVSNATQMNGMFDGVTLSIANYDALLNGWDAQTLQNGVTFSGGSSKYCLGETARQNMIDSDSWTITDGGMDCSTTKPTLVSPANKALIDERLIFFTWEPIPGMTRYTLEIQKDSDKSVVYKAFYNAAVRCDATSCTVPFSIDLEPGVKYKWHVIPWDGSGTRGGISNWYVFTQKLVTPVLRSPGDGNVVATNRPTFKWIPVYSATEYVIELLDEGGTRVNLWSWDNPVCGTYCEFRVPAGASLAIGDYQWRVRASNDERASDWSGLYTFTYE